MADQLKPESNVNLNDLPLLPFEKILSYLSLKDRISARAVSRSWRVKFDSKLNTLCYSRTSTGYIYEKSRLVSGAFARNHIGTPYFGSFFRTFATTILSDIKHLRLCEACPPGAKMPEFVRILNLFDKLEEMDIIRLTVTVTYCPSMELNLPMLKRVQFEDVKNVQRLILNAPKLKKAIIWSDSLNVHIVHCESVEWLHLFGTKYLEKLGDFKNLKYLYSRYSSTDPNFLSKLRQLKKIEEIHLWDPRDIEELFRLKLDEGRSNLKIFHLGRALDGPNDDRSLYLSTESFVYLTENPSKLAERIPFYELVYYDSIESVAPESAFSVLNRFVDLKEIVINIEIPNTQRFLNVLKNFDRIVKLHFQTETPQEVYDRLPEHWAGQKLIIWEKPADFGFLFRLSHLLELILHCEIDAGLSQEIVEELEFLVKIS